MVGDAGSGVIVGSDSCERERVVDTLLGETGGKE